MSSLVLAVVLFVAAVLLISLVRRRHLPLTNNLRDLERRMEPLDVEAFRVLVDAEDRQYLREHLPGKVFRHIQRERMRAAVDYVNVAIANAELITRAGEILQDHRSEDERRLGKELLEAALGLRAKAMFVRFKLYLCVLLPNLSFSGAPLVSAYRSLESRRASLNLT